MTTADTRAVRRHIARWVQCVQAQIGTRTLIVPENVQLGMARKLRRRRATA